MAGLNTVAEADGILILRILSPGQEVLLPCEVGLVIDHECPVLHPTGAASTQVRGDLRAVADALIGATLEVYLLEEDDLERKTQIMFGPNIRKSPELNIQVSSVFIITVIEITLCCMG